MSRTDKDRPWEQRKQDAGGNWHLIVWSSNTNFRKTRAFYKRSHWHRERTRVRCAIAREDFDIYTRPNVSSYDLLFW